MPLLPAAGECDLSNVGLAKTCRIMVSMRRIVLASITALVSAASWATPQYGVTPDVPLRVVFNARANMTAFTWSGRK